MVRRWSSINTFNFSLKNKNKKLFFFKKSSKYRVFRITVSVRKFYKKFTKFRRKAFNRLRHKTNWLVYSNILKFWSCDYLNTKSFAKKSWILNSRQFNVVTFNWSSVKNLNTEIFFNYNFNILNLNSFFFFKKIWFCNNSYFTFWDKFKNISISLSESYLPNEFDATPALFYYEDFFYEIFSDFNQNDVSSFDFTFFSFYGTCGNLIFEQYLNIYKTSIYLTVLDL